MKDKRFLVVDDDEFCLDTTVFILESLGGEHVETVSNARDALLRISCKPAIDVVLTDLNMPGMDGVDLIRAFQQFDFKGDIIIFSGEDQETLQMTERLARERNLSILGALKKPLQRTALSSLLLKSQAKFSGVNKVSNPAVSEVMLSQAILEQQIVPWYQPKVHMGTGAVVGVELLARWPESERGPIFPDEFIPVAEQSRLIDDLTFSLLEQAVQDMQHWSLHGFEPRVAINISVASLERLSFVQALDRKIELSGLPYDRFQLEVTESKLMDDIIMPLDALVRFRMKKLSLSIDDFGTGHSNLVQLRDLPFDEIKLDKSFVQQAFDSERARVILESSLDIAKKLNMQTVAEGVETEREWQLLQSLGCDLVQGYLVAKPMPAEQFCHWYEQWDEQAKKLINSSSVNPSTAQTGESARLKTLRSLQILDTRPEESYDRVTRLASNIFNVPVSLVSLVDENRQWFKSGHGVNVSETSRDISFCTQAVLSGQPLIIPDTHLDERFADNPLVTKSPFIRFYAGAPLSYRDGSRVGTLCIIDSQPRNFSDQERDVLVDLAAIVQEKLSQSISEQIDMVTSCFNQNAFEEQAKKILADNQAREMQLVFFSMSQLQTVTEQKGRWIANNLLRSFSQYLSEHIASKELVARIGAQEFMVLLLDKSLLQAHEWVNKLQQNALNQHFSASGESIMFDYGVSSITSHNPDDLSFYMHQAESNALMKLRFDNG